MLDRNDLYKLARALVGTREREIGCEECFERIDVFAEIGFLGSNAAAAMPLVHDHLRNCADCRETCEVLLMALRVR